MIVACGDCWPWTSILSAAASIQSPATLGTSDSLLTNGSDCSITGTSCHRRTIGGWWKWSRTVGNGLDSGVGPLERDCTDSDTVDGGDCYSIAVAAAH